MNFYDAIVIGAGPGGQKAALQGAKMGKNMAIIDANDIPGGFSTRTGTIPSKSLKAVADFYKRLDHNLQDKEANQCFLSTTFDRIHKTINREEEIARSQLKRNRIQYIQGHAKFISPSEVEVTCPDGHKETFSSDHIIIASGSRPKKVEGVEFNPPLYDSDTILNLEELPKSMIVEGGGVIGSEYASIFHSLGVQVTLVNHYDSILHFLDKDIREKLTLSLTKRGICMRMDCEIDHYQTGEKEVTYHFKGGSSITAECALICRGRQANIESLGLENTQIELEWGYIKVDKHYQTTEPGIYAVGDVIGFPSLASAAMAQGNLAVSHCFDKENAKDAKTPLIPVGIYTVPEVSSIGMTEEELKENGTPYASCSADFTEMARAQIDDNQEGFIKILFHPTTLKIYGVHIIGQGACDLIHLGQAVMNLGGTLEYFKDTPINFPTYSGAYKVAASIGLSAVGARV